MRSLCLLVKWKQTWYDVENARRPLFLFSFCCCDNTLWPETIWGGEGIFSLQVTVHHRRKLRQRPQREGARPIYFPWLAQPSFLYSPGPPAKGWHLPLQRHDLSYINQQSKALPHRQVHGPMWGRVFLSCDFSFHVCLAVCKVHNMYTFIVSWRYVKMT